MESQSATVECREDNSKPGTKAFQTTKARHRSMGQVKIGEADRLSGLKHSLPQGPQRLGWRRREFERFWTRLSRLSRDPSQNAIGLGFDLHHSFIGFDLQQQFTFNHTVAFVLQPGEELAGLLGRFKHGHDDRNSHKCVSRNGASLARLTSHPFRLCAGGEQADHILSGRVFHFPRGWQRTAAGTVSTLCPSTLSACTANASARAQISPAVASLKCVYSL